jgi:rsbT co-antagonist protein RsbR
VAACVALAAGAALALLYQARWGRGVTVALGAVLLLLQAASVGLGWWSARALYNALRQEADERDEAQPQAGEQADHAVAAQAETKGQAETLTAPMIPVSDHVVVVPLIGTVDQERLPEIRKSLLQGIEEQRARVALIDLTGVAEIAADALEPLAQVIGAVELMGCRVVLTGMSAQIARMLLDQGVDLPAQAHRDVKAGLAYATGLVARTQMHD